MEFDDKISEIIRVDHAGEYGAKVIYGGQIAALKFKKALKRGDDKSLELIEHMKLQEDEHFDYFNQEIIDQKIRPTLMQPIWKVAGFGLGFLTGMLDKKAAMACTVAVEEVIDEHYQKQISELENIKSEIKEKAKEKGGQEKLAKTDLLLTKINKFRDQELEHRDIGYDNNATDIAYYQPLTMAIKCFSKLAIFISTKI
jgi:ubiquinone biosynthesis monooxygenase Coq7